MKNKGLLISCAVLVSAAAILWILNRQTPESPLAVQQESPSQISPSSVQAPKIELSDTETSNAPRTTSAHNTSEAAKRLKAAILKRTTVDPSQLWDNTVDIKTRRRTAWHLARSSNPADFQTVTDYLRAPEGDPEIQALIIESLGESPHPEAREWILAALDTDDENMTFSALRGLAKLDNPEDETLFADLLNSTAASTDLRAEAALALGSLSSLNAEKILISAYENTSAEDEELRELIITGLGQRDISETQDFFQSLLNQEADPEQRLEILSIVSDSSGNAAPFFIQQLRDPDSDVRAEAAWALSMQKEDLNEILCNHLETEPDPEVRQRLYEALDEQENPDIPLILKHSLQEEDADTQLAALSLIAARLDEIKDPEEQESAEFVLAYELEKMAIENATLNQRMRAVIGLQRMNTDAAKTALKRVVSKSTDPQIINATRLDLQTLIDQK